MPPWPHPPSSPQYLPSLFVLVAAVFGVLTGRTLRTLPFVVGGTLASWAYLRFVQPQAGSGRGTPGADFSFASFFPEPVAPLAEQLAVLCSRLTGLRAAERSVPSVGSGLGLGGAVLPGTGAADAARRRCEGGGGWGRMEGILWQVCGRANAVPVR